MTPTRVIDTQRLATLAHAYERDIVHFLRELEIPALVWRIRLEMERVGFPEVRVDASGNIYGRAGSGAHVILVASRADATGAAGMAAAVYAGKLIHELGMYNDFTFWTAGFVSPPAPGDAIRADCVIRTEPTNLCIHRGALSDDAAGLLPESHPLVEAAIATYETLFELPPIIGKQTGLAGGQAPTIAFGPGAGEAAEGEPVPVRHLVKAAQFYAAFPAIYVDKAGGY